MNAAQEAAFNAGYKAAYHGDARAPALSADYMALVEGPVGSCIELAQAFHKGYQAQCDDEAAAILAQG